MSSKLKIYMYYLIYKHKKFKNRKKLINYQNRKIIKQLKFIRKHSKFYKNYKTNNLKDYPIIDKKIMMK